MITEQDLRAAIAECEGIRNPNASTCIKLAAFYTVLDQLYGTGMPKSQQIYSYESKANIPYSDSDFSKLVERKGIEKAFPIIDEVMEMLYVTDKPLYESIMRKIEY